jgi:hypothetical protein
MSQGKAIMGRMAAPREVAAAHSLCVLLLGLALFGATNAQAGVADVLNAEARCDAAGLCHIQVTIKHADIGWSHYADRFEILGPNDAVIATRVLRHPHVHEQPFTRTLKAVEIPKGVDEVVIRAHDSVDGDGGRRVTLAIERPGRTKSSK